MAPKRRSGSLLAYLETVRDSFFERDAPQNDSQFLVYAGFDLRPLGRNGLRSCCGDGACGSGREGWTIGGAACFAGDHASFFRADAGLYRALVWKGFLSRGGRASVVFCLPFLSWFRRSEFCGLHAVVAGA